MPACIVLSYDNLIMDYFLHQLIQPGDGSEQRHQFLRNICCNSTAALPVHINKKHLMYTNLLDSFDQAKSVKWQHLQHC